MTLSFAFANGRRIPSTAEELAAAERTDFLRVAGLRRYGLLLSRFVDTRMRWRGRELTTEALDLLKHRTFYACCLSVAAEPSPGSAALRDRC